MLNTKNSDGYCTGPWDKNNKRAFHIILPFAFIRVNKYPEKIGKKAGGDLRRRVKLSLVCLDINRVFGWQVRGSQSLRETTRLFHPNPAQLDGSQLELIQPARPIFLRPIS